MKKNTEYKFGTIADFAFANDGGYEMQEYGSNIIGENFLVLKHNEKDLTISFILTGYSPMTGNRYTCIYSDIDN